MPEKVIEPLDTFVFAGLQQRWQQQFAHPGIFTNAHEQLKTLERMRSGNEVEYPYSFLVLNAVTPAADRYNPHSMGRRGMPVVVEDGHLYAARIMPVDFEFEVQFYTDQFQGRDQGSVLAFTRRWIMARRFGYLKFDVNYGRLSFRIGVSMADNLTMPKRENVTEAEQVYLMTASLTVQGFISEPILGGSGVINKLEVDEQLGQTEVSADEFYRVSPTAQFKPFNRST